MGTSRRPAGRFSEDGYQLSVTLKQAWTIGIRSRRANAMNGSMEMQSIRQMQEAFGKEAITH